MLDPIKFIERYSARERTKIQKVCDPLFSYFGVNYLYYNHISPDGDLTCIGSHPEWMCDYFDSGLGRENPFFDVPKNIRTGVYLYSQMNSDNLTKTAALARSRYGLSLCFVSSIERQGANVQFGFSVPSDSSHRFSLFLNEMELVKRYFSYFENELSPLIKKAKEAPINLKKIVKPNFDSLFRSFSFSDQDRFRFLKSIREIGDEFQPVHLSLREKECGEMILKGYTAKEIANALDLSSRTVEFYIGNIKNKLGCSKRGELKHRLNDMKAMKLL